ncbi:protein PHOTOSYSTEM I ASSEMBLY 2, chloroplastic [Dendrobium catenatum]|uniref:protein PHOTOSYSTEM I ASSEMBLY 2, chloroplastic n=1 Tax=Dendrobium catenatum TaxID=906689 RepID=UPI0009F271D4|nr:protein PHOTOSYSTEM I ASSEMBLY 2, chloroplastic [Dendrobium catenatum]
MAMVYSLTRAPYPCKLSSSELLGTKKGRIHASKSGSSAISQTSKGCRTCRGRGAIECPGCKGTGKNKKNGNIFERWKCYDCQGFGLKSCPNCGSGGLTPEQRGER